MLQQINLTVPVARFENSELLGCKRLGLHASYQEIFQPAEQMQKCDTQYNFRIEKTNLSPETVIIYVDEKTEKPNSTIWLKK